MSSKTQKLRNTTFGRLSQRPHSSKNKPKLAKLRNFKARVELPAENECMESGEESESQSESQSGSEEATVILEKKKGSPPISNSGRKMMLSMFVALGVVGSGLSSYLKSPIGGGKSAKFVDKLSKQVFALLYYTKLALDDGAGFNTKDDKEFVDEIWTTALSIVTGETESIADHFNDLRTKRGLKDNTFGSYILLYKLFYYWFGFVFKDRAAYSMSDEAKRKIDVTFSNLSRFYGRAAKTVRRKERQTIEEKVAFKSWPENGFADLQMCVLPHIKALLAMDPKSIRIDEESYRHFLQVLLAAIYAYSVQGRIGGVQSMLLRQARDLIENGKKRNIKYRKLVEE